jgi:oxygen-independent coproporphyrinogen-3 oxidase
MIHLDENDRAIYTSYASIGLPRHTSYPIAPAWKSDISGFELMQVASNEAQQGREFSLYIHIPFCRSLCFYCGCTKEIVSDEKRQQKDPTEDFLRALEQELRLVSPYLQGAVFREVHFGGGTPTFLSPDQLQRLGSHLNEALNLKDIETFAVEIDPRTTTEAHLQAMKAMGVTRLSLGVQDFDAKVQQAVNRIQPFELVAELLEKIRTLGFSSVNFDLIYGLPFQTQESMGKTIEKVLTLNPDRIAFYRLAMIPELFRWQRSFVHTDLPQGEQTLNMNLLAIQRFTEAGYQFIGLDHFAKPEEALSRAHTGQSLQRNFQGMTTGKDLSIIGLGPSAISQLHAVYGQNPKSTKEWKESLEKGIPTARGLHLSQDDLYRRAIIQSLYSYGYINIESFEDEFSIQFHNYFAKELKKLDRLTADRLIASRDERLITLSPLGQLLVRVVASAFDAHIPEDAYIKGLDPVRSSKVG